MGWARFNIPLDTFLGHFGDGGVAAASARIVATVIGRGNDVSCMRLFFVNFWVIIMSPVFVH